MISNLEFIIMILSFTISCRISVPFNNWCLKKEEEKNLKIFREIEEKVKEQHRVQKIYTMRDREDIVLNGELVVINK